jgi:hypothetical protein
MGLTFSIPFPCFDVGCWMFPITAKHLKLTAPSGFGNDTFAALAELAVIYVGPRIADGGALNLAGARKAG